MEQTDAAKLSFGTLIGQEKAKKLLRGAAKSGKTPHGLLFRGPAGVGKKRTAATFAAYLNCLAPDGEDSCGSCLSCRKYRSGNHPDYHVIAPDGAFIKIDQIRALKGIMPFPPYEGRFRVVLLAEAHCMRREAANSLLKTLEEPPPNTILILACDESVEMLPTILSRCQIVPFHPLPPSEVAPVLRREFDLEAREAATLAALAGGSLGKARTLQEKGIPRLHRVILEKLTTLNVDSADGVETVFDLAEQAANLKENLPDLLDLLQFWLRDLIVLHNNAKNRIAHEDMLSLLMEAVNTGKWREKDIRNKQELIDAARRQLARNCNRNSVCEVLFFGLMA